MTYVAQHANDDGVLEREAEVLLAAVEQTGQTEQHTLTLRLVAGIAPSLLRVTTANIGRQVMQYAVQAARALADYKEIVCWLDELGLMHYYLGEYAPARRAWEEAAAIAEQKGAFTHALGNLASLASEQGEYAYAMRLSERQRVYYHAAGALFSLAFTGVEAASFARRYGDEQRAWAELSAAKHLLILGPSGSLAFLDALRPPGEQCCGAHPLVLGL
ncbi:MAG: hypothetical protein ABI068_08840 [Ktedonobacterales bacterium]